MPDDERLARKDDELTQLTVALIAAHAGSRGRGEARVHAVRQGISDGLCLDPCRVRTPAPDDQPHSGRGKLLVQRRPRDSHPPSAGPPAEGLFSPRATYMSTAALECRELSIAVYPKGLQHRGNPGDEIACGELFDVDLFHVPACCQHSLANIAEHGGAGNAQQRELCGRRQRVSTCPKTSAVWLTRSVPPLTGPPVHLRLTAAITSRPGSDK
jgi:hypothetical protein